MSLKSFAFLSLRARNYSPASALAFIRSAIRASVCTGANFETCVNIGQQLHGKAPIF